MGVVSKAEPVVPKFAWLKTSKPANRNSKRLLSPSWKVLNSVISHSLEPGPNKVGVSKVPNWPTPGSPAELGLNQWSPTFLNPPGCQLTVGRSVISGVPYHPTALPWKEL